MPPQPTLGLMVEALSARGWSVSKIAEHLGMNLEYARKLLHQHHNLISLVDQFRPDREADARHAELCLIEGGFPVAVTFRRGTAWLAHDGSLWRHLKRKRRAA